MTGPAIFFRNATDQKLALGPLQGFVCRYDMNAILQCVKEKIPFCVIKVAIGAFGDTDKSVASIDLQNNGIEKETFTRIYQLVSNWQVSLPTTLSATREGPCLRSFEVFNFSLSQDPQVLSDGTCSKLLNIYPNVQSTEHKPIRLRLGDHSLREFEALNIGSDTKAIRVLADSHLSNALAKVLGQGPLLHRCNAIVPAGKSP